MTKRLCKTIGGLLAIAGAMGLPSTGRAAAVDLTYDLNLDGMSTGPCAGSICATPLGTVKVTGDTMTGLTFKVTLDSGVSFHAVPITLAHGVKNPGPFFYFELTDPSGSAITFSGIGVDSAGDYSYNAPTTSGGPFDPNPGNFPGTYQYAATCSTTVAGNLCGSPFEFTASITDPSHPLGLGAPAGGGDFPGYDIAFVADLSIAAGTAGLCTGTTACTGLVGSSLASTVPEPATWALMALGFAGLGVTGFRKHRPAISIG